MPRWLKPESFRLPACVSNSGGSTVSHRDALCINSAFCQMIRHETRNRQCHDSTCSAGCMPLGLPLRDCTHVGLARLPQVLSDYSDCAAGSVQRRSYDRTQQRQGELAGTGLSPLHCTHCALCPNKRAMVPNNNFGTSQPRSVGPCSTRCVLLSVLFSPWCWLTCPD